MKKYNALIFDLDGTLWDASATSARGWNHAIETRGLESRVSEEDIKSVSGKPPEECVQRLFPETSGDAFYELALAIDIDEKKFIEADGGKLYPGVIVGIENLARHYTLFLVSNCQDWYLQCFWDQFQLNRFFSGWDCHGMSGKPKSEMILNIVQEHRLCQAIYIGDTEGDQEASWGADVDFGFASYGFGEVTNPALEFESFEELVQKFHIADSM